MVSKHGHCVCYELSRQLSLKSISLEFTIKKKLDNLWTILCFQDYHCENPHEVEIHRQLKGYRRVLRSQALKCGSLGITDSEAIPMIFLLEFLEKSCGLHNTTWTLTVL